MIGTPVVSIIICTCNRAAHLQQTLVSIGEVCVSKELPCELLIVDNGSTDATANVAQNCHLPNMVVRYLVEPRRGQCYARNTGITASQGRVIVFTDDDLRFPQFWISEMVTPILNGSTDAVAGGVRLAPHLERPWMTVGHKARLACTDWMPTNDPPTMVGANMAFGRHVLAKVPSFDTELGPGALGFYDESLFTRQLKESGFRVTTALSVVVEHWLEPSRIEPAHYAVTARNYGRSLAYIAYHWEHQVVKISRLLQMRYSLRLMMLRLTRPSKDQKTFLTEAELLYLQKLAFYRQYLVERRRPRNYEKLGLVKLRHD